MTSSEKIIRKYREMPDKRQFLVDAYLDDPLEAADRFAKSEEFSVLRTWAAKNGWSEGKVLDLGAGPGMASYAWASAGYEVVSCDPDAGEVVGLGAARSINERTGVLISFCAGAGENLPFRSETFAIVHMRQTLHHAEAPAKLCREAFRVLQRGGVFLLTREHVVDTLEDLEIFRRDHALHWFTQNENAYAKNEYLRYLKGSGFRVVRVIGPYDTVVNRFPLSNYGFRAQFQTALSLRVGHPLSRFLIKSKSLERVYARYLSVTDRTPGRLFSFIALKP